MHFKKDRLPLKKKKKNNPKIPIHHFSCRLENPIATKNVESKQTKETQHNLKKNTKKTFKNQQNQITAANHKLSLLFSNFNVRLSEFVIHVVV